MFLLVIKCFLWSLKKNLNHSTELKSCIFSFKRVLTALDSQAQAVVAAAAAASEVIQSVFVEQTIGHIGQ